MRMCILPSMLLLSGFAFAQSAANGPAFLAADIHRSGKDEVSLGGMEPGSRVNIRAATMVEIVSLAYGVKADSIAGGPRWVSADEFDILAAALKPATLPELQSMFQALLADRFQLKVRREDRPQPVYVLTIAKRGLQLKASKSEEPGDCVHKPGDPGNYRTCTGVTISQLAELLPDFARNYFDVPVVDRTGDKGKYDFTLQWTGRGQLGGPDSVSLYDLLEKLGIKADKSTQPMPAIVIESASETPAPNPPDTALLMPPMPAEFEVADIKVNKRPDTPHNFRIANGRVDVEGIPLKPLLAFAYNIDDSMVAGPGWLDSDMFDVVAKTEPFVDAEGMRPMVRKMIEERFRVTAHREERPVPVYAITAVKNAKLTEGDPNARGGCKLVGGAMRSLVCENATIAELAEKAPDVAPGYLDHTVVDLSGLKGVYNFTISWNGVQRTRPRPDAPNADPPKAGADTASDPGGGIAFFQGAEKAGLKFTQQKHSMQVLVVDKIDRTPSGN